MRISRRDFMAGIGGAAVSPVVALAQQPEKVRRVGVLTNVAEGDHDERMRLGAFAEELRKRGWAEGNDVHFERRWTGGSDDLAKKFALEFANSKPDVIFVAGTNTVSFVLQQTSTIPVVFVTGADPVKVGFVSSLARPGGNATGFAEYEGAIGTKWLELLREMAPSIARVVFLHSDNSPGLLQLPALQAVATARGIQLLSTGVHSPAEIDRTFASHAGEAGVGLIVGPSAFLAVHRNRIIAHAAQNRFPAMYYSRRYTGDGGLMSYGADRVEQYRRAASYVDRILKGARPTDLPVQQMEKYEFVINLKTARTMGLQVPRHLHALADELIE
jgi:ABC-type uncharacterized transport system substrate-binding protein